MTPQYLKWSLSCDRQVLESESTTDQSVIIREVVNFAVCLSTLFVSTKIV